MCRRKVPIYVLTCTIIIIGASTGLITANEKSIDRKNVAIDSSAHSRIDGAQLHFKSHNNITILHEVSDETAAVKTKPLMEELQWVAPFSETLTSTTQKPLVLNKLEILAKDKSSIPKIVSTDTIFDKEELLIAAVENNPKAEDIPYELNPLRFDFNLGDLEDLIDDHDTKKEDRSSEKTIIPPRIAKNLKNSNDTNLHLNIDNLEGNNNTAMQTDPIPATDLMTTTNIEPLLNNVTATSIYHISKMKSAKREHDLQIRHDTLPKISDLSSGTSHNSLSRYVGSPGEEIVRKTDIVHKHLPLIHNADGGNFNVFHSLISLYDHFYWETANIRHSVSNACGLDMQTYLQALHGNLEWAQKVYDASGRYRGQLLFGNDKWLGQKKFCYESNRLLRPDDHKHLEFGYYAAVVALRLQLSHQMELNLQVGECLPQKCTADDVEIILTLDPYAQLLRNTPDSFLNGTTSEVRIVRVRSVPISSHHWTELRYQLFVIVVCSVLLLVAISTLYQTRLGQHRQDITPTVAVIGGKVIAISDSCGQARPIEKIISGNSPYEAYPMHTLNIPTANTNNNNNNYTSSENRGEDELHVKTTRNDGTIGVSLYTIEEGAAETYPMRKTTIGSRRMDSNNPNAMGKHKLNIGEQILLCFAFQTNAAAILNISARKDSQTSCLHGLRVLSVLWTILVHTYLQMFNIGENRYERVVAERSLLYQFVGNATFSVDTFFFISGLLVTMVYLKHEKQYSGTVSQFIRRGSYDTFFLLIYRYIRLTPVYLFVVFLSDYSLQQTIGGAVIESRVPLNTCYHYWWRNILYVNNFYSLREICMIWSWYMANDMQFYVMASILLVLSTRYFKAATIVVVSFLLSSWAISGIISLKYGYTHKVAQPFESFDFLYDKPWQRVGTYIIGMFTGYILHTVKKPPNISPILNYSLWTTSIGLLAAIIFGVWNGELNLINTAFYVSIGHTAFGVGLVWLVLSCCWRLSPTMNQILSYRALWPLSRLTYCTYLIHPVIMLFTSLRMDGTVHLNHLFIMFVFLGNAVASFIAGFFISVFFEAPVIKLLKIFFKK